jgi:hypothetical protein
MDENFIKHAYQSGLIQRVPGASLRSKIRMDCPWHSSSLPVVPGLRKSTAPDRSAHPSNSDIRCAALGVQPYNNAVGLQGQPILNPLRAFKLNWASVGGAFDRYTR